MQHIDGFRTTDSFRYDRNTSSSTTSLSSSSGYGSRLSLSSSSNRRHGGLTKYFREKISKHKSLASLILSSKLEINTPHQTEIYESVWNLEEQIDKLRSKIHKQTDLDTQSIISMSVDTSEQILIHNDKELLSAAAWYQEGLPRHICEEYLNDNNKSIGSFIIRHSYTYPQYPFVLSIKTNLSKVEHFLIEQTFNNDGYRLQYSSKTFHNLSTLVLHHTIMPDILPVTLILPLIHSTLTPFNDINQRRSSPDVIRSVRF
ncbi:unnamed protein product [Adineta steineri]|uniref:SH2 domain-containing protein n=1 Tax=Adineta steineri TaxID=433720 RepID=A0A820AP90_9BILA|nr:unnamed protein product [Adineta steineri]CAF4188592.1 unnamed protein product [Adineta steineri]